MRNIRLRRAHDCVCGTDLPGTCPGRAHCPYSGDDEDDDLDADRVDASDEGE